MAGLSPLVPGFLMPTYAYILVSLALFFVGAAGVLLRRNVLIVLMSVEMQLAAGTLALLSFSRALGDQKGHVFAFFVMALAAAEAAVGLAIVVSVFRTRRTVSLDEVNGLKG
jgi:NADH-quinone oxidoreductase subunit K